MFIQIFAFEKMLIKFIWLETSVPLTGYKLYTTVYGGFFKPVLRQKPHFRGETFDPGVLFK